ncbi:MAG: winged helix-turn-helix domain-containing protein [Betaproteobacteria bacterium]
MSATAATINFGHFELRVTERQLWANGRLQSIGPRAFDLLVVLVGRAGQLVSKRELLDSAWRDLVVEENNLPVQVCSLRKVLGPHAIATIPGRGYRFALPIADTVAANEDAHAKAFIARHDQAGSRTNLPLRSPTLFGRADDVKSVKVLLAQHVVVTIVGAGGIGKSCLAHKVASEFATEPVAPYPDGVWWIDLAALGDGALVPSEVARAMGIQQVGEQGAIGALTTVLASKQVLLVLDSCEHVRDAVATFVDFVCAVAPGIRLLVTSQEPLKASGEHVHRLGGLAVPEIGSASPILEHGSIELFVSRANAVAPRFALDGANAEVVAEICRRLDGIPLAIELAAARLPLLGIEGLRDRLDQRFNVLTANSRVVLRRHQTLRATLEWSHGLLTIDEQIVFRRLGVFAGGFTLEAAQEVAHDKQMDDWAVLDHLGALVDKSLVLAEGDPVPRYRLAETTAAFALERLAESGETDAMLCRHAEAMIAILSGYGSDAKRWRMTATDSSAAAAELENLRAAFLWATSGDGRGDLAVALAAASAPVWNATFHYKEGVDRCVALRGKVDESMPSELAARYWLTIAMLGLYTPCRDCYNAAKRAADLYRELGDDRRLYDALLSAAAIGVRFGIAGNLQCALDEAAQIERPEWPPRQRLRFQWAQCRLHSVQDRPGEALACALRQSEICREEGDAAGEQYAMSNVAGAEIELGRLDLALEHARVAIARLGVLGADAGAGHLHYCAMKALTLLGRLDEGMAEGRIAKSLLQHEGDDFRVLESIVLNVALAGRHADAARITGLVDAVHTRSGEVPRPGQVRRRMQSDNILVAGLGAEEFARQSRAGASMSEEQAFSLAFGKS